MASKHTTHKEQLENEVYMGNSDGYPSYLHYKTIRVGKTARYANGNIIKFPCGLVPWFVDKSELENKGYTLTKIDNKYCIKRN